MLLEIGSPRDTHVVAGRSRWRRVLAQVGVGWSLSSSAAVATGRALTTGSGCWTVRPAAHEEPMESGRQNRVPLLPPGPETEQRTRKDILRELVLPVYVTQPRYGKEEQGEAGLSKAISVS